MDIKIRSYNDFINEEFDKFFEHKFVRFYMIVKDPYPTTMDNPLGKMIGETRKMLFDQVEVTNSNYQDLKLKEDVPVLNFTEDNKVVEKMVKDGVINKESLYNVPERSTLVSDKVSFHKTFSSCDFVPRAVFSVDAAKSLKFPIIAKPAQGKSAEGIRKFETIKDLEASDEKFDVFCEMIDIDKEYRCFCFKDKVMEIDERIEIEGSDDFLADSSTTTNFFYKKIDKNFGTELDKVLDICRKIVKLDFFSLDFATTKDGKIFVIEMNSRTGMGVDKMVKLYEYVHEDFYKKPVDSYTKKKLDELSKDWEYMYNKEKGSKVNECTTVAGNIDGVSFLFKNRDRSYTPKSKIINEKVNGTEVVYYTDETGWVEGMNEHGVGFVFSQLTNKEYDTYGPAYTVSDDPKNSTNFLKFKDKIKKVLTAKTSKEAVQKIIDSKKSGSFLVSDTSECYELEVFEGKVKKHRIYFDKTSYYVKTNHGVLIQDAGHQPSGDSVKRAGSQIRKHQAIVQLQGIQSISEVPSRMKFQAFDISSPMNVFRTDAEEYTISQCMMDLTNVCFYFFHDKLTANSATIEKQLKDSKIKIEIVKQ